MTTYRWNDIPGEQLGPLTVRRAIHGATMTMGRFELKKGCVVPMHSHVNEQFSTIESGCLKFMSEGKEILVRAGETLVIPPNVPHSAEAVEDTVATDFFAPIRQDWVDGTDAYLRK
ncbi:MAG: cupin domain-containing protein [Bryobacteraceae bacterium]